MFSVVSCENCQQMPSIVENVWCCYFEPVIPNLEGCGCIFKLKHCEYKYLFDYSKKIWIVLTLTRGHFSKLNIETNNVELWSLLVVKLAAKVLQSMKIAPSQIVMNEQKWPILPLINKNVLAMDMKFHYLAWQDNI